MSVALDHVILPTNDHGASAAFVSKMLDLPDGIPVAQFISIPLGNGVTIDVMESEVHDALHLAFLVDDETFDRGLAVLRSEHLPDWADPGHAEAGSIHHRYRGRGVYFADPSGNNLELLTRSTPLPTTPCAT